MPTYISWCNSKPIALSTSLFLWSFALIIWYKRFKINKLLNKNGYGGRN